jgi:tRNA 2-thiouridine synthesizing protein A
MEEAPFKTADCAGLLCPLPVLRARKILVGMPEGSLLEVITTDPMALVDLPHFCAEAGHEYLGLHEDQGQARHRIRRGSQASGLRETSRD